jgi:flagellar export protein FliJ
VKKFSFKFEPLLKLRKNQRDVQQQRLAEVLRRDDALLAQRHRTETERNTQIEELRSLGSSGVDIDIDASTSRRIYAAQLSGQLDVIDGRRTALARQIDECRQALVRADQAVKALEKLAENQQAEFIYHHERREARDLEEAWQAIHAGENDPC